jgi:hypothetical protein
MTGGGAAREPSTVADAVLLVATIAGMLGVAYLAWRLVQRQERGDARLEELLKADDERAERGRRADFGTPAPADQAKKNVRRG